MSDTNIDTSTTAGKIAVMRAFEDGKKIQFRSRSHTESPWTNPIEPVWSWDTDDYRIAPEPPKKKLVPWEVTPALIGKIVKHKKDILACGISTVNLKGKRVMVGISWWSVDELLNEFMELTWNGNEWVESPCGTEVTE